MDSFPFENTAIVADIHRLPFADGSVSGIFCTGTLEHVEDPCQAMSEMCRVLKPSGLIHIEVPFMQPFHPDPVDYWRWTLDGIRLFAGQHGLEEVRSGTHLGPASAMNVLVITYWQSWFRNRTIRKGVDVLLHWLLWPFKYLDALFPRDAKFMPSGVFLVARKP